MDTWIIVLVLLVVLALVAMKAMGGNKTSTKSDSILLVGPCNGGKSAIFLQLRDGLHDGRLHPTHTSMVAGEGTFVIHEAKNLPEGTNPAPVHLIDMPGHRRLRPALFDAEGAHSVHRAAGVVMVLDVQDYSKTPTADEEDLRQTHVTDAAELLYELMTTEGFASKEGASILIACNKEDLVSDAIIDSSPTIDNIRSRLVSELEQLRTTRASFMAKTDGDEGNAFLGVEGEKFTFENAPVEVTFVSASAKKGKLGGIIRYIDEKRQ